MGNQKSACGQTEFAHKEYLGGDPEIVIPETPSSCSGFDVLFGYFRVSGLILAKRGLDFARSGVALRLQSETKGFRGTLGVPGEGTLVYGIPTMACKVSDAQPSRQSNSKV